MIGLPKPKKADRPSVKKKKLKAKRWEEVREQVIESARVGDRYQCSLCGQFFARNEICADHIISRGARPDLFLNILNLRACCMHCNQSDNPLRNA